MQQQKSISFFVRTAMFFRHIVQRKF